MQSIDEQIERVLESRLSVHIATAVNDRPHVAPVWFIYENGRVWFITGGKKVENIRKNPRVALSIERYDRNGVDWAVQLLGTARIVTDEEKRKQFGERLGRKYDEKYATDGSGGELIAVDIGSSTAQWYD